jgi:NitT/TauT family transport system permease protein
MRADAIAGYLLGVGAGALLLRVRSVRETDAFVPNGHVTARVRGALVVVTLAVLVGAWCAGPAFLPTPLDVVRAFGRLWGDGLALHLYVSLTTNLQSIALSCLLTLPLAYLSTLPALRPLALIVSKLRFLGLTGFVMLFTVVFGGGHALKVALIVFGMSVFLLTSIYDIVESIPREAFDEARTLRMGRWRMVLEVVVLGHFDEVLNAIRQNAAVSWMMLTMVEGLVRFEGGLGALMLAQDRHIALDGVFAIQGLVLVIGLLQDVGFVWLRKMLCPFADLTLERR